MKPTGAGGSSGSAGENSGSGGNGKGGTGGAGSGGTAGESSGGSAGASSGGAAGASNGGAGGGGSKGGKALLVSRPNQRGDAAITKRLEGLGFQVARIVDKDPEPAERYDLIVLSEACESADLGNKYTTNPAPVITAEQNYLDVLGAAQRGAKVEGQTAIRIEDPAHPIAAGLTGTVEVYTVPHIMTVGKNPSASPVQVATLASEPDSFALMAVEKGADLGGIPAPARRVHWFLEDEDKMDPATMDLTPDGWKIFDACVKWATSQP